MQHCVEIAEDFQSRDPGAYFYIFRPGFESRRLAKQNREDELHSSRYQRYNRVSILGVDMSDAVISDVKEFTLKHLTENRCRAERK
jgi:hypothetical protein